MKKLFGLIMVALFLFSATAFAAEIKIGYVNLNKVFNTSDAGKAAKSEMEAKFREVLAQKNQRENEINLLREELETKGRFLAKDVREEKEREYQQKLTDLKRWGEDQEKELQQKEADYNRQIFEGIDAVIQEVGKKEGYSLIFERARSAILFGDENIDMTEKIIKAYNASYKKGQ